MPATAQNPYDNPLNPGGDQTSATTLQPFTGGSNIAPMPVQTGDNPFTDVLNHVSAFNSALGGTVTQPPVRSSADVSAQTPPFASGGTVTANAFDQTGVGGNTGGTGAGGAGDAGGATGSSGAAGPTTGQGTGLPTPPAGGWDPNRHPKPQGTEDPEIAAGWYRQYADENPAYANITADDVTRWRMLATSGQLDPAHPEFAGPQGFTSWFLAGAGGQYQPGSGSGQPGDNSGVGQYGNGGQLPDVFKQWLLDKQNGTGPFAPGAGGGAGTGTGTGTGTGGPILPNEHPVITSDGGTGSGTTGGTDPTAGGGDKPGDKGGTPTDIQSLIDMFKKESATGNGPDIESMLNPMFGRQRQKLDEQLRAQAALTPGRLESGGFGMNEGQALTDLSGQQSAKLADLTSQEHLAQMQQNTQLMTLATTAGMQKYVADLNADLTKFQVNSNADLQKWLDSSDNTLKKYGIDTQDLLARYQSELQLKGQMYGADRGVDAAALQAAAAHAAASASAAASMQNAQLQFQLGMQGLGVDREKNIGQFILGLLGQGNMDLNSLNGILNGLLPGTVVAKP